MSYFKKIENKNYDATDDKTKNALMKFFFAYVRYFLFSSSLFDMLNKNDEAVIASPARGNTTLTSNRLSAFVTYPAKVVTSCEFICSSCANAGMTEIRTSKINANDLINNDVM